MRDSAGTTQFEVLPYVKKYVKKQFYKDKNIYEKNLEGGRYYTNYYIEKYNVKDDTSYESKSLKKSYLDKLVLGWNIGVCYFFDYVNFNKFDYYKEFLKLHFFKNSNFSMKLQNFQNWTNDAAKYDFVCLVNKYYDRNSVGFQRMELIKKLKGNSKLNYMIDLRLSKKDYYNILRKSKISIGQWMGKLVIESLKQSNGTAIMFPDMSNIDTWPNIYIDNKIYISYDLDFDNLEKLTNLLMIQIRRELVQNSQDIMNDLRNKVGEDYFIKKIFEIISV